MRHLFDEYLLDTDRRELHREIDAVPVAPQVFDILDYLINRGGGVRERNDPSCKRLNAIQIFVPI